MDIAQNGLGLSDEAMEDAIDDSHAIRRFVGIDLGREAAPDATALLKFRRVLHEQRLTEAIFATINAHLAAKGLMLRQGMVVGTAANVSDVTQASQLLHGQERDVFADEGYQGVDKREEVRDKAVTWHVAMRPGKRRALDTKSPMGAVLAELERIGNPPEIQRSEK